MSAHHFGAQSSLYHLGALRWGWLTALAGISQILSDAFSTHVYQWDHRTQTL
jgi:hypothetical protein